VALLLVALAYGYRAAVIELYASLCLTAVQLCLTAVQQAQTACRSADKRRVDPVLRCAALADDVSTRFFHCTGFIDFC
jgi:hypothetical protein